MSVKELFEKLLPEKTSGKLRIMLSLGANPTYMIYSQDKSLLDDLSNSLAQYTVHPITGQNRKPAVWTQKNPSGQRDIVGDNKYYLQLDSTVAKKVCEKFGFNLQNIEQELRKKGAVLSREGHRADNADKYEIDFSQKVSKLERFKQAYTKQYKSEFFKNPFSTMKRKLAAGEVKSIDEVQKYAEEHPNSRTAKVWNNLKPKR